MSDFTDGRMEVLELVEAGDRVATKLRFTGTGQQSGIEVSLVWGAIFEFSEGRIVRVAGYPSYEESLGLLQEGERPDR
jgi:ketosteroid isomerase-like protein